MNDVILAELQQSAASAAPHQHDCWEMLYCISGDSTFVLADGLELLCREGDMVVIPPETSHHRICTADAACICLHIANATLALRQPALISDDENASLRHLFSDVNYLFSSGAEHRTSLLPTYGQLIAQHISIRRPASPRNLLVEEIAQSIVQNYANPNYELDELLRSAPYCYDYLCRLFRQELHTTPHKYLTDLRLQAAADLLRGGSGSSVTEIARMCGYHDPLYFSRMFKKRYNVSPREYARQSGCE